MGKVVFNMSMSLDGFIAGPNDEVDRLFKGIRLFEHPGTEPVELENTRVVEGQGVTHLQFRVVK